MRKSFTVIVTVSVSSCLPVIFYFYTFSGLCYLIGINVYDYHVFVVNWVFPHYEVFLFGVFRLFQFKFRVVWRYYYYAFFLLIFVWLLFLKYFDFPLVFVLGVSLISQYQWEICNSRWNYSPLNEWLEPIFIYCGWWCGWTNYLHVCVLFIVLMVENLLQRCIPRANQRSGLKTVGVQWINAHGIKTSLTPPILIWFDSLWQNNSIVMGLGLKFKLLVKEVSRRLSLHF